MATYCFRCQVCAATVEGPYSLTGSVHCIPKSALVRDYAAEGVQLGAGTRPSRTDDALARKQSLILPHAEDFQGPDDPDGSKGMREWRDNFEPGPDTPDVVGNNLPKSHF